MLVQNCMSSHVTTVCLDDSLDTVRELLHDRRIHHVVVLDGARVVGVVSDRDMLLHLSPFVGRPLGERPEDTATLRMRVHQFMTRKPITIDPRAELEHAAELMLTYGVSCLPVTTPDQHLLGIITTRDMLRAAYPIAQPIAVE